MYPTPSLVRLTSARSNTPAQQKSARSIEMTNVVGFLRKTLKRSTNAVRRVGKMTRKTVKRGTNAIGLTKRRKSHRRRRHSRK